MTWRITLAETSDDLPVVTVIKAQAIWKRLPKAAQQAVEAAYPHAAVKGHAGTVSSLLRHGFVEWMDADPSDFAGWCLTDAAKAVARWNVPTKNGGTP